MKIEITDLHYRYPSGLTALQGINLQVQAGERVAIAGHNGCGKTTLIRHLNGLLRPTQGRVLIGDWNSADYSVAKMAHRVGYVFQNPDEQICKRKVYDEVKFGAINLGFSPERVKELVDSALSCWQLQSHTEAHPHDLSPGKRRKVVIASVLAMDTPILVLDEPTTGQDNAFIRRLVSMMDLLRQDGKTVIIVSHDMEFIAENFDRVIVMEQGEILLDGAPHAVLRKSSVLRSSFLQPPQLYRLVEALDMSVEKSSMDEFLNAWSQTSS